MLSTLWRLVSAVVVAMWQALHLLPSRLRETDFWLTQAAIAVITGIHFAAEISLANEPWWGLHHLPVVLYILPIAYVSIKYSWEGGLLTSGWIAILVLPSVLLWHLEKWMWLGELARVLVVVAVGITLASRVEREASQRRRAEASEVRFRSLFEAAADAILVFRHDGVIVAANQAAALLVGAPDPQVLPGQHIGNFVPLWMGTYEQALMASRKNNGPSRVSVLHHDGQPFTAEAVVSSVSDASGEGLFQAVLRDATLQEMREKGLRSLVGQVTQAQEEERERIARELHDDTLQAVMLLTRELEGISAIAGMPKIAQDRLAKMTSLAISTGETLRRFSRDLRPSLLNDLGLVPALEWLTEDLAKRAGVLTQLTTNGAKRPLHRDTELTLFRIAQEALRNVEKHAHASRVEVSLAFLPERVELSITDDGVGFSLSSTLDEMVLAGRLGLIGLKERASLLNGTFHVDSSRGKGTKVHVTIPA